MIVLSDLCGCLAANPRTDQISDRFAEENETRRFCCARGAVESLHLPKQTGRTFARGLFLVGIRKNFPFF